MGLSDDTRVHKLVTALDAHVEAVTFRAVARANGKPVPTPVRLHEEDTRGELSRALAAFVLPPLRLIDGGKQDHPADTEEHYKPKCDVCFESRACFAGCDHWAAAIRKQIAAPVGRAKLDAYNKEPA